MDLSIYRAREGEYENEEAKSLAVGFYLCERVRVRSSNASDATHIGVAHGHEQ